MRGVCGIDESTKDMTAIGRFGIGFKSVNAYTDLPEVHSGPVHFAIERYVHPVEVAPMISDGEETRIILPFRKDDQEAFQEIANALKRLGARTLLFLHQIDTIEWSAADAGRGLYLRDTTRRQLKHGAEQVSITGSDMTSSGDDSEDWIVFSQPVQNDNGVEVGHAELAFLAKCDSATDSPVKVLLARNTELVVYFPTIVASDVGFLIQGPYRTTPSRDNIVNDDPWNRSLVHTTAELLVTALEGLRELNLLGPETLETLPLDRETFGEGHLFSPLCSAVLAAFRQNPLLPTHDGDFIIAGDAKLARGTGLRTLLDSQKLSTMFTDGVTAKWLDKDITPGRTPRLHRCLVKELDVEEITPEELVRRLDAQFLEDQTDGWIEELYTFLAEQTALWSRYLSDHIALVRLEDGTHVPVQDQDGNPRAFLPGKTETDFPTVCSAVCRKEKTREFLKRLGLSEPDLVDDVIAHILPKYPPSAMMSEDRYASDIERILAVFETDSFEKKGRLKQALRKNSFVLAEDAASKERVFARPDQVYIATERLKELFDGVKGVLLVADIPALRKQESRDMLLAVGAARYLQKEACNSNGRFTIEQLCKMRTKAGCKDKSGSDTIKDHTLRGLDALLKRLCTLDIDIARRKAFLLWESLCDLEQSGSATFQGIYEWFYYTRRICSFDAVFIERLRSSEWIIGENNALLSPAETNFDSLGWKENRNLQEWLRFKLGNLDRLAQEAGIDPNALHLIKQHNFTKSDIEDLIALKASYGRNDVMSNGTSWSDDHTGNPSSPEEGSRNKNGKNTTYDGTQKGMKRRKLVTYIHTGADDYADRKKSKAHKQKMKLEKAGIRIIRDKDPRLKQAGKNNPGFDLVEKNADGNELRWVEVKTIKGAFSEDSWVTLSRKQFDIAKDRGKSFWLYIVEYADTPEKANIICIRNPTGKAKSFVFDHGWRELATEFP